MMAGLPTRRPVAQRLPIPRKRRVMSLRREEHAMQRAKLYAVVLNKAIREDGSLPIRCNCGVVTNVAKYSECPGVVCSGCRALISFLVVEGEDGYLVVEEAGTKLSVRYKAVWPSHQTNLMTLSERDPGCMAKLKGSATAGCDKPRPRTCLVGCRMDGAPVFLEIIHAAGGGWLEYRPGSGEDDKLSHCFGAVIGHDVVSLTPCDGEILLSLSNGIDLVFQGETVFACRRGLIPMGKPGHPKCTLNNRANEVTLRRSTVWSWGERLVVELTGTLTWNLASPARRT